ncbi:MAG: glycerophosphodiester phosphodiesterase family protein [Bacteroidales bacterium]|nr:glycerophosphodiester phosphodiesterase family protein [Bacteroidales bacterium]
MRLIFVLLMMLAGLHAAAWKPVFVGHRGCNRGVENTAEAFHNGVDVYGYTGLECDVRVTKDGYFVISHDETTTRLGGNLTVASATLAELQAETYTQTRSSVTYTGHICTMEEYLDICVEKNAFPVIELKWATGLNNSDMSNFPRLAALITEKGLADKVVILTSMQKSVEYVHKNYPQFQCQWLCAGNWATNEGWCRMMKAHPSIQAGYFDIETVNTFRRLGLKVAVWTVDSEANYKKYGAMGVSMMTCNSLRPDQMPELDSIDWSKVDGGVDPLQLKCDTIYSFSQYKGNLPADFPHRSTKSSAFNTAMQAAVVDGIIYTNDCKTHTMLAYGPQGRVESRYAGTSGTGICTDSAGNLIVRADSLTTTPNRLVIYPKGSTTGITVDFSLLNNGQTYFISASGDVMSERGGHVYFYPKGQTCVNVVKIASGTFVETTASGTLSAAGMNTSLVIPLADDAERFIYQSRTSGIYRYERGDSGEYITGNSGTYPPARNTSVGSLQFTLGGHTLFVHPSGAVHNGGFTIRDITADQIDVLNVDDFGNGGLSANMATGSFYSIEPIDADHCYLYVYTMGSGYAKYQLYVGEPIADGPRGDVNADGEVNVSDVTALINAILGTATYDATTCDINTDGTVNVSDVTALINLILG